MRADHSEWEAGHIPGATHLPLAELSERAGEIDKERPVVLYCRGGNRSTMAADALAAAGFDAAKLSEGHHRLVPRRACRWSLRAVAWPSRARRRRSCRPRANRRIS